jgi:hypothetical protein
VSIWAVVENDPAIALRNCFAVCFGIPFALFFALVIALAVYDWRKTRRTPPPDRTRPTPPPGE